MVRKKIDLDILDQAASRAKYPSEDKANASSTNIVKLIPGGELKGVRVVIKDPQSTQLWDGNPRNFDYDKSIDDLVPKVKQSGGNTEAVAARRLPNGVIEIIAGSRRRRSVIEAGVPLVADVWENVTEEIAEYIAYTENDARRDISTLGMCTYLAKRVEDLKLKDPDFSIDEFAQSHLMKKSVMYDRIAIGKLPEAIKQLASSVSEWSLNQAITLNRGYRQLSESLGFGTEAIVEMLGEHEHPKQVLKALDKALDAQGTAQPRETETEEFTFGKGSVVVKRNRSGDTTLKVSKRVPSDLKDKILDLIRNYS